MVQKDFQTLLAERGSNYYYHYNAVRTWAIAASGEVTNHAQTSA